MNRCIVYIQYTNPIAYPPLVNSARELAKEGFEVIFLGLGPRRESQAWDPEIHPFKFHYLAQPQSGVTGKLHYLYFCAWTILKCIRLRPSWIYGSDLLSSPILRICRKLFRCWLIYHEHDLPSDASHASNALRFVLAQRKKLLPEVWLCITPNQARAEPLLQLGLKAEQQLCVWNCPSTSELPDTSKRRNDHQLIYQGSLNPQRLPCTVLDAMRLMPDVDLVIVGYETIGHTGYMKEFLERADKLGLSNRVNFVGDRSRKDTLRICAQASIGLALTPVQTNDMNLNTMFGASNKVFEYLGCGCPVLVTEREEWHSALIERNLGYSCNPNDPESIANSVQSILADNERLSQSRLRGIQLIQNQWNYQAEFSPIIEKVKKAANEITA